MSSGTATIVKTTGAKKQDFRERWNALPPAAQDRFYQMKCRELLVPPRYSRMTFEEHGTLMFMRDNQKPIANGKGRPMAEPLMVC